MQRQTRLGTDQIRGFIMSGVNPLDLDWKKLLNYTTQKRRKT